MTRRCAAAAMALLVVLAGCSEMREVLALQRGLAAEFGTEAVTVSVEGSTQMTVAFINSPFSEETRTEQALVARRAAEYVSEHYKQSDTLVAIYVTFGERRSVALASVTETGRPFRFTPEGLRRTEADVPFGSMEGESQSPH